MTYRYLSTSNNNIILIFSFYLILTEIIGKFSRQDRNRKGDVIIRYNRKGDVIELDVIVMIKMG
jgi:hypothetical protein